MSILDTQATGVISINQVAIPTIVEIDFVNSLTFDYWKDQAKLLADRCRSELCTDREAALERLRIIQGDHAYKVSAAENPAFIDRFAQATTNAG